MAKNHWVGKHVHNYDAVTVASSGASFESKSCIFCGESRVVTRIKSALKKFGIR